MTCGSSRTDPLLALLALALALVAPRCRPPTASSPRPGDAPSSASRPSVVSIQVDGTRAFDTEWNESSQATGFVVDAERGLILTNRHVVTAGPVRAEGAVQQPGGGRAHPGLPGSGPRLRLLSVRSGGAEVHPAEGLAAVPGRRRTGPRDPGGRQRRWRAAVDPVRHAGAPAARGARIRAWQVQRFQHLLPAGGVGHLRRLIGLPGHRHRGQGDRAQRRRQQPGGIQLLPAPRPGPEGPRGCCRPGSPSRAAPWAPSSATPPTTSCGGSAFANPASGRPCPLSRRHRHAGGERGSPGQQRRRQAPGRRHPGAGRRRIPGRIRATGCGS